MVQPLMVSIQSLTLVPSSLPYQLIRQQQMSWEFQVSASQLHAESNTLWTAASGSE